MIIDGGFAKFNQVSFSDGGVALFTFDPYLSPYLPNMLAGDAIAGSTTIRDVNGILAGGYGFATFCYFSAFVISLAATILISPYFGGSPNERKIINAPFEVQGWKSHNFSFLKK